MSSKTHKNGAYIKDRVGYSVAKNLRGVQTGDAGECIKFLTVSAMCGALALSAIPGFVVDFQDVTYTHDEAVVSQEYKAEMDSRIGNLVELNETIEQLTRNIEIKSVEDESAVEGLEDALTAAKDQLEAETKLFGTLMYTDGDMTEALAAEYIKTMQDNNLDYGSLGFEASVDADGLKECQLEQVDSSSNLYDKANSIENCMQKSGESPAEQRTEAVALSALTGAGLGLLFGLLAGGAVENGRHRPQPTKPKYADYKRVARDN